MESLLLVTNIWLLLISFVWFCAIIFLVEKECIVWSGINIILLLLFFNYIIKINIFDIFINFLQYPGKFTLFIIGYLIIGFIWSFIKWWLYVNKLALKYKEKRYEWLLKKSKEKDLGSITIDTKIPKEMIREWLSYAGYNVANRPSAIKNKKSISHWVIYWPLSILGSLLNDFIGKVIKIIIVKFRAFYEIITKNAYKNVEEIND